MVEPITIGTLGVTSQPEFQTAATQPLTDTLGDIGSGAGDIATDIAGAAVPQRARLAVYAILGLAVVFVLGQLFDVQVG